MNVGEIMSDRSRERVHSHEEGKKGSGEKEEDFSTFFLTGMKKKGKKYVRAV